MASSSKRSMVASKMPHNLTNDDKKVLGPQLTARQEKTALPSQYKTMKFRTQRSSWTPVVHRPSNEQIFKERRELVANWFDLWTDSQRRRFLDLIFRQCNRNQLLYIQKWFDTRVPLRHVDMTKVFPRFLSLYIFSFLDPRSLCRASMVCWYWKFLAEQDVVWIPKCTKLGWFLPYTPEDKEYGAWKWHYVACTKTLDTEIFNRKPSDMYGGVGDGSKSSRKQKREKISAELGREILELRPPWMPTDPKPQDLDRSRDALLKEFNPNDPALPAALLLHHTKQGTFKPSARQSCPNPTAIRNLQSSSRRFNHRAITSGESHSLKPTRELLSECVQFERYDEQRLMEIMHTQHDPPRPKKLPITPSASLSGGANYPLPWKHQTQQPVSKSFPHLENPRIIFISSRVPAADLILDAVLFGVIPLVYEYEGTTLHSLINRLDRCLQGRNAQSIGIFLHGESWEMRLIQGATVTIDNLDDADFVEFFYSLASHVLPASSGGHIDVFVPLAASEPGLEMINQLNVLTGACYTCPTGLVGTYNHVSSEWLRSTETVSPPPQYFCESKLNVWANTADIAQEACQVTKDVIGRYFEQKHRDVASQLVGQVVFDALGQADIPAVEQLSKLLTEGLLSLQNQENVSASEYLGQYLIDHSEKGYSTKTGAGKAPLGGTLAPTTTMSAGTLSKQLELDEAYADSMQASEMTEDDVDCEVAALNSSKDHKDAKNLEQQYHRKDSLGDDISSAAEVMTEEELEDYQDEDSQRHVKKKEPVAIPQPQKSKGTPHVTIKSQSSTMKSSASQSFRSTGQWNSGQLSVRSSLHDGRPPHKLTSDELTNEPEKRSLIAREILASEWDYLRMLDGIYDVFYFPLNAALASNRAILSAQNMQMIFNDSLTLRQLSKQLNSDLKSRLSDWGPQQCLGDIFIKFSTNLKTYVNFMHNYPLVLGTIEKCTQQTPLFRAFLQRREKTALTKMLTLSELLLTCTRRIGQYVTLLTWFYTNTPEDHADRGDLSEAIKIFTQLDKLIQESKQRNKKERELLALQKKIVNCPHLLESNRFLIRHLEVSHLKAPSANAVSPELRLYQHVETMGLFLFNDSMVVTRVTHKNFPFERCVENIYFYMACASLSRLRVEDIPDSKYVRNAFHMHTPKQSWLCAADSYDDKFNWVSLLEQTVRAALDDEEE